MDVQVQVMYPNKETFESVDVTPACLTSQNGDEPVLNGSDANVNGHADNDIDKVECTPENSEAEIDVPSNADSETCAEEIDSKQEAESTSESQKVDVEGLDEFSDDDKPLIRLIRPEETLVDQEVVDFNYEEEEKEAQSSKEDEPICENEEKTVDQVPEDGLQTSDETEDCEAATTSTSPKEVGFEPHIDIDSLPEEEEPKDTEILRMKRHEVRPPTPYPFPTQFVRRSLRDSPAPVDSIPEPMENKIEPEEEGNKKRKMEMDESFPEEPAPKKQRQSWFGWANPMRWIRGEMVENDLSKREEEDKLAVVLVKPEPPSPRSCQLM